MLRREFFHPRNLLGQAAQILEDELSSRENEPAALLRFSRRAMATTFEVILPFGTPLAHEAAQAGLDEIDRLEAQLTVYRDDSEISRINQQAAQGPIRVEENLFQLLCLAEGLTRETQGAFDITVGALIKAWGFFRRQGRVPGEDERAEVMTRVGMEHLLLDKENQTVRMSRPGVEINLGSIGKGYALDRVAGSLTETWGVQSALLSGGHSSLLALGRPPNHSRGWAVGIRHPWSPGRRLGVLYLRGRALGTSAATFQNLEYNGRKLGHILDPRRGWPAEGMASASVLAPSAAEADALATAFFILGLDFARTYCAEHPRIGAVLLSQDNGARPVVLGIAPGEIEQLG